MMTPPKNIRSLLVFVRTLPRKFLKNKYKWKTFFCCCKFGFENQLQFKKQKFIIVVKYSTEVLCISKNIWTCINRNKYWKLVLKKIKGFFFLFWTPKIDFWIIRTIRKCNFSVAGDMLVARCKSFNHISKNRKKKSVWNYALNINAEKSLWNCSVIALHNCTTL